MNHLNFLNKTPKAMIQSKATQLIDEMVETVTETQVDTSYRIGEVVTLVEEETEYVGIIEDDIDGKYTIRIYAVAGTELEPTDKIMFRMESEIKPYEKSIEQGILVKWNSEAGLTHGKVVSVSDNICTVEVYVEGKSTRVEVQVPVDSVERTLFEVKEEKPKILCKMEDVTLQIDEQRNVGIIEGWGSTYGNVDLGGDTIAKGAYTQTLRHKNGRVQMFFDHGWSVPTMAGVSFMEDKDKGLWVRGELPLDATDVKDAFVKIKFAIDNGVNPGFSIGYNPIKYKNNPDGTRTLNEIALEEMTITPFPMDTEARILSARVKSIQYKSMATKWATIPPDAPKGNQNEQGALALAEIKSLITQIRNK
jgi:HK97 family phage prohead protease